LASLLIDLSANREMAITIALTKPAWQMLNNNFRELGSRGKFPERAKMYMITNAAANATYNPMNQ
jgi:hypothetical protein